jgi:hypothetical protein
MKKLLIGCGVVLVVALIAAAVATYFVVNKVKSTVAEFAVLGEIPEIERGVRNTTSFSPPPAGELTAAQVETLVTVQQQIRTLLGARFTEFERKYAELSRRMDENRGTVLDAPAVIGAYRDMARLYVDAKKVQVTSLNEAGLSLDEYRWIRQQAYAALGVPILDADVGRIIESATSGDGAADSPPPTLGGAIGPQGPESNKALVEPHRKVLEDNAALGFFGL